MQKKVWIGLEGMEFYAYHGVYEEERIKGANFIVDVMIYTDAENAMLHDELSGTVNYELVYQAVAKNMQTPVQLIEHLAYKIITDIRTFVVKEDLIRIKIKKMQPPLNGNVLASVVEVED
ncbi:MAG TPA: dihydroneopterin aldolase [Chitinophagales bacterium]|nr:dihydroneopterin aldolase [Chitinophagales bacterium]HMW13562.1 dihydroneopterin aldolase [Chitinophagales bacterium]HMX60610.1 dihydroneopterin aldolase [Chitinophagales bacterium]HMY23637.1 dihydroneopterin aldolase [Chitinophagales bacterium]HMZ34157.1 dihydroneopterin aldolase [Chitinophagales bacterium]